METLFSKIIRGEVPCHKIAENDKFLAFLDIRPIKEGHTLVIPKAESEYIFDMEDSELSRLMVFAKSVAGSLRKAISCKRIGIMVAGLEVPHTHIHLIPMDHVLDLNFANGKPASGETLAKTAEKIRKFIPSR